MKKSLFFVSVFLVVFCVGLIIPAALVKAGSILSPQPPLIGGIKVIGTQTQSGANYGRTGNVNKVGANDKVFFQILDNQGQSYPSNYIYVKDGQPQGVVFSIKLDLRMGNGTIYSPFYALFTFGNQFGKCNRHRKEIERYVYPGRHAYRAGKLFIYRHRFLI